MQIVSFSLYGAGEQYNRGAVVNAALMHRIYPGWTMRCYCDSDVTAADDLDRLGVDVRRMSRRSRGGEGMFWRFMAAADPDVELMISRDADSRINVREAAAVAAWVKSGKSAHVMRDHAHHVSRPMLGGMFGLRSGVIPDLLQRISRWQPKHKEIADMLFLQSNVWPDIEDDALVHLGLEWPGAFAVGDPWPEHEPYDGFVGEQIG